MFDNLSERLTKAARNLAGKGRLSESNIKDTLRQVRLALLEADVALPIVKSFIERIRERVVGEEVGRSLTPGQALVKIIHSELVTLLGDSHLKVLVIEVSFPDEQEKLATMAGHYCPSTMCRDLAPDGEKLTADG